jgi:hypothetical protein
MQKHVERELNFICKMLYSSKLEKSCTNQLLSKLDKLIKSCGLSYAVKWVKANVTVYLREVAGLEFLQPDISLSKNNILLRTLRRAHSHNNTLLINVLTSLHKNFKNVNITLEQVKKFTGSLGKEGDVKIPTLIPSQVVRDIRNSILQNFNMSDVRTDTLVEICYRSPRYPVKDNWDKIESGKLRSFMEKLAPIPGTIRYSQETGLKCRFFAYASPPEMGFLRNLQKILLRALSHIPQDCTFDQPKGCSQVIKWLEEGRSPSSLDLSNATDRFPADFSHSMLKLASKLVESTDPTKAGQFNWYLAMVRKIEKKVYKYEFSSLHEQSLFKEHALQLGRSDRYAVWDVGQPLGLPHSFPLFALSHHMVMKHLNIKNYVLLGDDVVIRDRCDALRYKSFMTTDLKVSISEPKSFYDTSSILDRTSIVSVAQFAGRTIVRRQDCKSNSVNTYLPISCHTWSKLNLQQKLERGYPESAMKSNLGEYLKGIVLCTVPEDGTHYRTKLSYALSFRTEANLLFKETLEELQLTNRSQLSRVSVHSLVQKTSFEQKNSKLQENLNIIMQPIPTATSVAWDRVVPLNKPKDILVQQFRDPFLNGAATVKAVKTTMSLLSSKLEPIDTIKESVLAKASTLPIVIDDHQR